MEIEVLRFSSGSDDTLGILLVENEFECFTLEDEHRDKKVRSETRIPEGTYDIGWMDSITPLTQRYRNRFQWFDKHIHLKEVPNFTGIYIHIGNDDSDTAGCILVGNSAISNKKSDGKGFVGYSTDAYKKLYKKVEKALNKGEKVIIKIKDYA